MDGLLILVLVTIVSACIVGADSFKKSEYETRQKSATERWEKANKNFFSKATNRSIEASLERSVTLAMYGSSEKQSRELAMEIKDTYKEWLYEEPYYIKYLGVADITKGMNYDMQDKVHDVLMMILMANRGYITTGCAIGGVKYNAILPGDQCQYIARKLDKMLKSKGINEDLYVKPYLDDAKKLTWGGVPGGTGAIIWKSSDPYLYYEP